MVAHNHLEWDLMPSSGVSEDSYSVLIYIQLKKIFGEKKKKESRLKSKGSPRCYKYNQNGVTGLTCWAGGSPGLVGWQSL